MLSWFWSEDDKKGTYSTLSIPGSQYIDNDPITSYDYLHEFSIYSLHIAFDKILISGSYEFISVDMLDTGENIRVLTGDFDWVYSIGMIYGVTPLIATAHRDCLIRLWDYFDTELEEPKIILSGHAHAVVSLGVFQGANPLLISASFDTTLSVWDVNAKIRVNILKTPKRAVRTLSLLDQANSKESFIVCGDDAGVVYVWSKAGIFLKKLPSNPSATRATGEFPPIKSLTSSYWNNVPRAYVGYDDGYIRVFNLKTGEQLLAYQGHELAVRSMVIVEIIEPPQPLPSKQSSKLSETTATSTTPPAIDFSIPLSTELFSSAATTASSSTSSLSSLESSPPTPTPSTTTETHQLTTSHVPIVITAGYDGYIRAWDTESGELIRSFTSHEGEIFALTVTQRTIKPVLISGGVDRSIKCWRLPLSLFLSTVSSESTGEMVLNDKNENYSDQRELDEEVERQILQTYNEKIERTQNQVDYVEEDDDEEENDGDGHGDKNKG